ncbi:hypothetical protein QOZ80_1AG0009900 [Eleusine coracana subsp. coracana]|nr:hypothetical protein QOZ80_1AG0009900 [Eleusine coracana subsp. coracana]
MSTITSADADNAAALLAFKAAAIGDGGYRLPSWNASVTGGICSWEGVTCQGKPRQVVTLSLSSRGLNGVLSPVIGNLSSLTILDLGSNMLSGCHTRKSWPSTMSRDPQPEQQLVLRSLGAFPRSLARLKVLKLWKNNLTGTIPVSMANLSSLSFVSLAFNQFEGTIPPGLDRIASLRHLDLAYNHLSGESPHSLYNLSSLEVFQLQGNMLHGEIPYDIGSRFPRLWVISLAFNQFTGSIPESLTNLTALQLIEFTENKLSGHVPRTLGKLPDLVHLILSMNRLQADDNKGGNSLVRCQTAATSRCCSSTRTQV